MVDLNNLYQSGDWKKEKHTPVIEIIGKVKKAEPITIHAMVGKEIGHPNTTEHHIRWIEVYFLPEGEKFPYQIGKSEFSSHGASINGANSSTVYSEPNINFSFKTEKSGTIIAFSSCNIHGLWQNTLDLKF
ncbi:MAG: class II SORL domain-containing protein [Candidatus Odinarchaeota archaeon]